MTAPRTSFGITYARHLVRRVALLVLLVVTLVFLAVAIEIVHFGERADYVNADAAIVLGAAAWGNRPSPVYRERINEALRLYHDGRVHHLIFTGGTRDPGFPSEAEVARKFALQHGVPDSAILLDTDSHTTQQNLANAKIILQAHGLNSVLLVSDPLHMLRVMAIARGMHLDAVPAPTESSRFQSWSARAKFLWRETWIYIEQELLGWGRFGDVG